MLGLGNLRGILFGPVSFATMRSMSSGETIVFIDSECVMCDGFAKWLIPRLNQDSELLISPIGGSLFNEKLSDDSRAQRDAILLLSEAEVKSGFSAVLDLASHLNPRWKWPLRSLRFLPTWLGETLYDLVARHRKSIWGRQTSCSLEISSSSRYAD